MPLAQSVTAASRIIVDRSSQALSDECAKLLETMRARCPGLVATIPLGAGDVGPQVALNPDEAQQVFQVAFADAFGVAGAASGNPPTAEVVWASGADELLVRVDAVRLVLRDGFALVSIPVYTEQTQDVQVVVPFALGAPDAPLGLVMATEVVPRGPALVIQRWGEHLQAVAWAALLHVAAGVAGAAGVDDEHQPLLPAALVASANGLSVLPQARHTFDRRSS